jgi:hypothetical protein
MDVGGRTAIFCGRSQRLAELNACSSLIWAHIASGLDCESVVDRIARLGVSATDAERFVDAAAQEWLALGFVTPSDVIAELEGQAHAALPLRIGGFEAELCFYGEADAEAALRVFGQFRRRDGGSPSRVSIVGRPGFDFLFQDGAPLGMLAARQTVPKLKALLTDGYCRSVRDGFLAHGALLSANGLRVFIAGAPGAGKTTLSLALNAHGFAYAGDDIVHIGADGAAEGVPFAAAVKSGAWSLLEPFVADLPRLPVYQRTDGKVARYVLPALRDGDGPRPIDIVLLLARKSGAEASLRKVAPLEALCALIECGYAERRALEADTLRRLAQSLSRGACYRLCYDSLPDAVATVRELVHG